MTTLQILILSAIQGLSEFLPISSSGHLILAHYWGESLGWTDPGLPFDVALHIGSAIAVILYFRADLIKILSDSWQAVQKRAHHESSHLGMGILIATLPAIVGGLFIKLVIGDELLRSPALVGTMLILFALLLGWATLRFKGPRTLESMTFKDYILIGLAQAVALIPGTSRSGITITAGLFRGLSPDSAARFSFLLSLPAILLAGGYESLALLTGATQLSWISIFLGILFSALISYFCIHFLLTLIRRFSLIGFVIYRVLLGAFLIFYFASPALLG
jgi:undecaprenyl-diphosphatase